MFNPLLENVSKIKDQDLDKKILDLTNKYYLALRLGNGSLANQVLLSLDTYRVEQQQRQINSMKEMQNKQKKQGLDDLINVD
jgi:hypothetical protein